MQSRRAVTRLLVLLFFVSAQLCHAVSGYLIGGPNSGHSTVVVFIHGYRGSNASWTSAQKPALSLPAMVGSDPDLSKFADVYLIDYATDAIDANASLPATIAKNLRDNIYSMSKDGKKNIVFVCHSMGGLVAWELVDDIATLQAETRIVKTVITFGTPYLGTPLNQASFAALVSPNKQVYALLQIHENPYLDHLLVKHNVSTHEKQIDSYCAYETKPMKPFGMIVDRDSATAFCSKANQRELVSDHEQLVKPDSPAYPDNFNFLKAAILESSRKWTP